MYLQVGRTRAPMISSTRSCAGVPGLLAAIGQTPRLQAHTLKLDSRHHGGMLEHSTELTSTQQGTSQVTSLHIAAEKLSEHQRGAHKFSVGHTSRKVPKHLMSLLRNAAHILGF